MTNIDHWLYIEPYVFVKITNKCALLYNTLDQVILESDKYEVISLLHEILLTKNCGVILLTNEQYRQREIYSFIQELRYNYMGDIIDVSLSKGKPVQLLPGFNYSYDHGIYNKYNFSHLKNIFEYLSEISIHIDAKTDVVKLVSFLQSIPGNPIFNIVGNIGAVPNYRELLFYFDQHPSLKNILYSYKNVIALQPDFRNNFSQIISISFPIDVKQWDHTIHLLLNQTIPVEYIFDVSCDDELQQAEKFIDRYQIEKYRLNPIYSGDNILFFEENVFLTKEDILSIPISIKDFFLRQAINIYDYGKININPNGDAYANLNHPVLGNIYKHSIYEIVQKEIDEGNSWFRIRNQAPCNKCVYQWLCPSPSDYEIYIGRPNLCHVKN